jgi:superfamily II DNA or RNA helicase
MSVGESIKNLHNLFIVSSKRSKIAILQALGRLMRLHHSKSHANLYDIIDNLTYKDKRNFSYNHSFDRLNHYDKENHELNFIKIDLK